ncbi:MAG: hypothetical protein LBU15_00325 [Rickettsiales bacterium]|jgi:hypothetical protein|nr:hypothetical protein [Rickettsiales bacterium]
MLYVKTMAARILVLLAVAAPVLAIAEDVVAPGSEPREETMAAEDTPVLAIAEDVVAPGSEPREETMAAGNAPVLDVAGRGGSYSRK